MKSNHLRMFVVTLFLAPILAFADESKDLKALFSGVHNLGDLILTIKDPKAVEFFKQKSKGQEALQLKIQVKSPQSIVVRAESQNVPIELMSESEGRFQFKINHKSLEVNLDKDSLEQIFDRVQNALPRKTASLMDLILPKAEAQLGALVKVGGLALAAGAGLLFITEASIVHKCNFMLQDHKRYCEGEKPSVFTQVRGEAVANHIYYGWIYRKRCEDYKNGDYKNLADRLIACLHRGVEKGQIDEAKISEPMKKYYGLVPFTEAELETVLR